MGTRRTSVTRFGRKLWVNIDDTSREHKIRTDLGAYNKCSTDMESKPGDFPQESFLNADSNSYNVHSVDGSHSKLLIIHRTSSFLAEPDTEFKSPS